MNDDLAWAGPAAALFWSLSNEVRVQVLLLLRGGEMSSSALQQRLGRRGAGFTQHMKSLVRDGLVVVRHEGHFVHYRLSDRRPAKELYPVARAFRLR